MVYNPDNNSTGNQYHEGEKMLRGFWNKLTKYSIIGLALFIVCVAVSCTGRTGDAWVPVVVLLAVLFFIGSLFLQICGIRETRRFTREDALRVYRSLAQTVSELRVLSVTLHKEYGRTMQGRREYSQDRRYKAIERKFTLIRKSCKDYELDKKLAIIIRREKAAAKYLSPAGMAKYPDNIEYAERDIREYFLRRFPREDIEMKQRTADLRN
jgi:hypothetical protein